jgi:hypothetical protein
LAQMGTVNIRISVDTYDLLVRAAQHGESMNQVVRRLAGFAQQAGRGAPAYLVSERARRASTDRVATEQRSNWAESGLCENDGGALIRTMVDELPWMMCEKCGDLNEIDGVDYSSILSEE